MSATAYVPSYPPLREAVALELPPAQFRVLKAIHSHLAEHGRTPTLRRLCEDLGIASSNGVACSIRPLVRKGYLCREEDHASRNLLLSTKCFDLDALKDDASN